MPKKRQPTPPESPAAGHRRMALPIFLALFIGYLLIFFTAPAPDRLQPPPGSDEQLTRIDMALWLVWVRPWQLLSDWTGGDAGSVSLLDRAGVLLVAGVILLVALFIGWLLIDLIGAACGFTKLETFVFSLGVGLNALSLLCLLIGMLGLMRWLVEICVVILIFVILSVPKRVWSDECLGRARIVDFRAQSEYLRELLCSPALWLSVLFALVILAGAILPPREFDVREYHLQAPKEWFEQGAITFMPHNVYANMPLGPEMLTLPAMAVMPGERAWWWGALAGKVVLASYSIITMLALYAAGRRFFNATAGVVAGLVYISIPWVAFVSIEGYVDGALAANLFLAVYAAMLSKTGTSARPPDVLTGKSAHHTDALGLMMLSGFLAGAAVSCKYTGVVFAALPLAAWSCFGSLRFLSRADASTTSIRASTRERIPRLLCFLLALLAGCGLWLGKNWMLAGNPVYPLAYSIFGGQTRTPEKDEQWQKAHAVPKNDRGQRYSASQIGTAVADVAVNNAWPSPILYPLAILALFIPQHRRTVLIVLGWFVYIIVVWFLFTHRIDRFWIPALPFAALLAGVGVTWRSDAWWRGIAAAILFCGLTWNLLVMVGMLAPPKLLVDLHSLQADSDRVHSAHLYLNEHVPEGKSVLLVGDAEPFDLQVPALYNTCFDDSVFEQLMKGKSKDERLAALRERNISHVHVHWGEIARYRNTYGYADYVTPAAFRELVEQGVLAKPRVSKDSQSGAVINETYAVTESAVQ